MARRPYIPPTMDTSQTPTDTTGGLSSGGDTGGTQDPMTSLGVPNSILKNLFAHTLLSKAKTAGDLKAVYDFVQPDPPSAVQVAAQKKAQVDQTTKKSLADSAQGLLNVLDMGKSGQLKDQAYKDALDSAASQYAAAVGFGVGGKALTGPELSILGGQIPTIKQQGKSFIDNLTGNIPEQKGHVTDSPESLRRKAQIGLALAQGRQPDYAQMNADQSASPLSGLVGGIGSLLGRIGSSVGDVVQDPGGFASALQTGGKPYDVKQNYFGDPNAPGAYKTISPPTNQSPGYKRGAELSNILTPLVGAQMSTSGVDFGPINAGIASKIPSVPKIFGSKAATATQDLSSTIPQDITAATPKGPLAGILDSAKGKLMTSVATPNKNSVTQSEELMQKALQITTANTDRGVAKQLETFNVTAGRSIENMAKQIDTKIGQQPLPEVTQTLGSKVLSSDVGRTHPEVVNAVLKDLEQTIKTGDKTTSLSSMNEGRKIMNNDLNNWFNAGQPTTSPTDIRKAVKWEFSKALKDTMGEADPFGYFKQTLDLQHAAIESAPAVAQKSYGSGMSDVRSVFQLPTAAARTALSPLKTALARLAAGKPSAMTNFIKSGAIPPLPAGDAGPLLPPGGYAPMGRTDPLQNLYTPR